MNPFIPHLTSECLIDLKFKSEIVWPLSEKKYLVKKEVELVIQINGKKRSTIKMDRDIDEKAVIEHAKKDPQIKKYLDDKTLLKYIFVKNRLINLIIK
jgi:leucyl-tRNA synthetase